MFNKIHEFFSRLFCNSHVQTETELQEQVKNLNNNLTESYSQCLEKDRQIMEMNKSLGIQDETIKTLKENMKIIIPTDIETIGKEILNEYPIADITYGGYKIRLKDTVFTPSIKVQDFIQTMHSHRKFVENNGMTLNKYLAKYPELSFGEVVNKLMFDIFKKYIPRKIYFEDITQYGIAEQWNPALDSWYLKKMDCENSTLELMSLFEAAGLIGSLKNFYWNVCGNTSLGGHSTLYCYDFKNKVWRHLETTDTMTNAKDFYALPNNKSTSDILNITSVWWSFNSDYARHTFNTSADKNKFKKRERFRDFVIKS